MAANNGKDSESAFVKHWEAIGHIERLRDKKDLMGLNGGRNVADFAKPSDFLVSARGVPMHYAEVKSMIKGESFAFGGIQPGQHIAALKEHAKGCGSYIFYIFSYENEAWYTMSCDQYAGLIEAGKRSVKFKDLALWDK